MDPYSIGQSAMTGHRPTAGIILAAGMSTRFGRPKQLVMFQGKPLISRVLEAAFYSRLHTIVLVLGYRHQEIIAALGDDARNARLNIVVNTRFREGQSTSLKQGLLRVKDVFPSVMFLVADQPLLDTETIDRLLSGFWESDKDIAVPVYRERRGNPVVFGRRMYPRLLAVEGDAGARSIVAANPDRVLQVSTDNPMALVDIDTPKDLKSLRDATGTVR